MAEPMIVADGLTRTYRSGRVEVRALRGVSFRVEAGELVAVRGRSGAGKTTLLRLVGGLDRPDSGTVRMAGREVTSLDEPGLLRLRREVVGFVFQSCELIPVLSAAENVEVPLRLARMDPRERDERVELVLALAGVAGEAERRPYELSGGQQQRVAIARALAGRPRVLLADEPTGRLDSGTARSIMELLRAVVRDAGVTAVVATHDPALLAVADRVLELRDGVIAG